MRTLVLVSTKLYVRDFVSAGAFADIEGDETFYAAGEAVDDPVVVDHPRFAGHVEMPKWRSEAHRRIRGVIMTAHRRRSRTARIKHDQLPAGQRWRARAGALPGVRHARIAADLRRLGLNLSLERILDEVRPDLIVSPSNGLDAHAADAARSARERGIPVLGLMYNWDNLSSKSAFTTAPDYLGVVGYQSVEHAERIHGFPRERVAVLGSPYIDGHFHHRLGSTTSPFPFPYVLFAGCYQPFDELTALRELDAEITRNGLDLTVVYLPHPKRLARRNDDFVDDTSLEHVVVHPTIRDSYIEAYGRPKGALAKPLPLDAYPALLENAQFVVCPLSTMMLEAAIFGERVLVIAYHDGIHPTSPGVAVRYLHFEGVDGVRNFEVCREQEQLAPLFSRIAREPWMPARPPKDQMDDWVYHDERPFSRRLADFTAQIARREGLAPHASGEKRPERDVLRAQG